MTQAKNRTRNIMPLVAVTVWAGLCLSLASWWLLFSMRQLESLSTQAGAQWAWQQRMLIQEGIFLIVLLLLGAVALFYYSLRERRRSQQVREFFAVFTHEVKTSLASLRLQVESLEEDLKDSKDHHKLTQRILKDSVRLELQLENSLLFSSLEDQQLFWEDVRLEEFFENANYQWPEIRFEIRGEGVLRSDRRYLDALFKNLFHNAYKHGQATSIEIDISSKGEEAISVLVTDNGKGFSGDPRQRGKIFYRHQPQSGSGLGLHLVEALAAKLGGSVFYPSVSEGFAVGIVFSRREG